MRRLLSVLLILGVTLVPVATSAAPRSEPQCQFIEGHFIGSATLTDYGFDSHVVELTGPLSGPAVGSKLTEVHVERQLPDGTILFKEYGNFQTTALGDLVTYGGGRIASNGHVDDWLNIVSGGSGFIYATGIANVAAETINVNYYGFVCSDG